MVLKKTTVSIGGFLAKTQNRKTPCTKYIHQPLYHDIWSVSMKHLCC